MTEVILKDNEIWAKFDIHDVKRLRVGVGGGYIKEIEVHTKKRRCLYGSKGFYIYCLQRMTECNISIDIEGYPAVGMSAYKADQSQQSSDNELKN